MSNTFRILLISILHLSLLVPRDVVAQLPDGFEMVQITDGLDNPAGIRFLNDSTSFIWTYNGTLRLMVSDELLSDPVLDIREETGIWGDHGMLGMALHPDFLQNGYLYLLYNVDTHYLLNYGTPEYDPNESWHFEASMGRLTRYTLNTSYPYEVIGGSRTIMIGDEIGTGIPIMSASHGTGSIQFGSDGSMLVSTGEGSTWVGAFTGGPPFPEYAYDENGMAWGILPEDQNIGSYRAQYLDSYSGKLLRLDPITGLGLPSNPFFDEADPDSPRSKVWSLGLRNPFRFCLRPGTGASDPDLADPGSIYIGDVGYYTWEEINVVNGPALNFGWPKYEGMNAFIGYDTAYTYHPNYPNPLFQEGACNIENLRFQDLVIQPVEDHTNYWGNPCDQLVPLSDTLLRFTHERPVVAYTNAASHHDFDGLTPGYNSAGEAIGVPFENDSDVEGSGFTGIASIGGDFYYGTSFPEEYFGAYFQTDYQGWMRTFWFNENDELTKTELFSEEVGPVLFTAFNPYDECLYVVSAFPSEVFKICFAGNVRPIAAIAADVTYGSSPLTVQFSASQSFDADGDPITFNWDFGDGQSSEQMEVSHVFTASDSTPTPFWVELSVSDTAGNVDTEQILISLNNTPPQVSIVSIEDSSLYSMSGNSILDLVAEVVDEEHSQEELSYEWQTVLIHNTHEHAEPVDTNPSTTALILPAGCVEYATYRYDIRLTVTDAAGLIGYDDVSIYPDCDSEGNGTVDFDEYLIYPNPNDGLATIRGPFDADEAFDLEVFDLYGRLIFKENRVADEFGRLGLDLKGMLPGQYLIRLGHSDGNETLRLQIH